MRRYYKNGKLVGGRVKAADGLWANIHAKRERIKAGSGEKMRKKGAKGAPTAKAFKKSAKLLRKKRNKQWLH